MAKFNYVTSLITDFIVIGILMSAAVITVAAIMLIIPIPKG